MPVISSGQASFLRFEITHGDAGRKKAALQEICRRYRRGDRFNAETRRSFEATVNGIVLAERDPKVVRWCLNALARIGTREGCERYVLATLRTHEEDPEIVAAAVAALAHVCRGRLDGLPGLGAVDPAVRVLAAMQTTSLANLDLSGLRIDIDTSGVEVLKLALLTVGLNRDIHNLLHPRHGNGAIVRQLGQHDDRIVRQYSVWCVMENRLLTLDDLGIPFHAIDAQPPNVQAKLLQLAAEREPDARTRHGIIHNGTFSIHPEARTGLAKGLVHTYYDGLEDLTLDWFRAEQDKGVRGLIAEHVARFSDACGPYADQALAMVEEDPSLRDRILLGSEGTALYGRVRAMDPPDATGDLFNRSGSLDTMFRTSHVTKPESRAMKVLFLAANPSNQGTLRLDVEARELREQVALVRRAARTVEVEHAWAVRTDQIQREILNVRPEILHFSGHGSHGILAFENDRGEAVAVSGEALAELVSLCPSIRCVMLNACFSDTVAAMVAPHVEAVVGCDDSVDDGAASRFTRAFYRALAHGESFQASFRLARNELALSGQKAEGDKYTIRMGH